MRFLVTGGSGLLGSKIGALIPQKHQINLGYNEHPISTENSIKLDITDPRNIMKVFEKEKPDIVIHSAALSDVDRCEINPELAWKINVQGTRNIVKASKQYGSYLIYVSTDYVFSGEKGNYNENDETSPINKYGITKLAGESEVKAASDEWCIVRPSVIYGSTPAAGKTNFVLWVINKLKNKEQIRIITDQWISPTLNTNLAQMIIEIAEKRDTGIYHLAGATQLNRYQFALEISKIFQLDSNLIIPVTSKDMKWAAKRPGNTTLNVEKATKELKHKPMKIEDALKNLRQEVETSGKLKL